jgi:tetratricopeptide (TPR) repeat protein
MRVRAGRETALTLVASTGLALLALGAKPSAVAAPLLLMAVDWMGERSWRSPRRWSGYLVAGSGALLMIWVAIVGHSDLQTPAHVDGSTIAQAGWAASLQLRHLVAPGDLAAMYFAPSGLLYAALVALGFGLGLAIIGAVVWLARSGQRVSAGALAAAAMAYAPVSGVVEISRGPADSYMYTPLAVLVPGLAVLGGYLWHRGRRPLRAVMVLMVVVFAMASAARTQVWSGPTPLWTDLVEEYPDEPLAHQRVANALQWEGKLEDALEVFEDIRERWPGHPASAVDHAFTLDALRRPLEAEAMFAEAARLGADSYYRKFYGEYVLGHPGMEPSDSVLAEQALAELGPLLLEQRAPAPILERAADLLELGGQHEELVASLRAAAGR